TASAEPCDLLRRALCPQPRFECGEAVPRRLEGGACLALPPRPAEEPAEQELFARATERRGRRGDGPDELDGAVELAAGAGDARLGERLLVCVGGQAV